MYKTPNLQHFDINAALNRTFWTIVLTLLEVGGNVSDSFVLVWASVPGRCSIYTSKEIVRFKESSLKVNIFFSRLLVKRVI